MPIIEDNKSYRVKRKIVLVLKCLNFYWVLDSPAKILTDTGILNGSTSPWNWHFIALIESESHSVMSDSLRPHGLYSPRNSPGQNTGVGSISFLQGIFPTQGSNPSLLHCKWILYQLSHQGDGCSWNLNFMMYVYQVIFLYTLSLYSVVAIISVKLEEKFNWREKFNKAPISFSWPLSPFLYSSVSVYLPESHRPERKQLQQHWSFASQSQIIPVHLCYCVRWGSDCSEGQVVPLH